MHRLATCLAPRLVTRRVTRLALAFALAGLPAFAEEKSTVVTPAPSTAPATTTPPPASTTAASTPAKSALPEAERKAFRDEVRAYLLENPEVLIEAMDVLQAREEQAALLRDVQMVSTHSDVIFKNPNDWVGGNPDGDVTLVEFMDYRCGYCRQAYAEVEELIKTDGKIRFIVKEFPILGDASMLSAQFAIAVLQLHGDKAYASAHNTLMTLRGEPTPETLTRVAKDLGLDAKPIFERMKSPAVMKVIQDNYALAEEMEITGTPAFVLEDQVMRGYAPVDVMRDFVADARTDG